MNTTEREARKDALRYAKAEMDYGEGAGIKRRHLKAELGDKFEDSAYKEAFDAALEKIDYDEIIRDLKVKKRSVKVASGVKKLVKTAGVVTPAMCGLYQVYKTNKFTIDEFFKDIYDKANIKKRREDKKAREKCMEFVNRQTVEQELTDEMKAKLYLRSKGIRV